MPPRPYPARTCARASPAPRLAPTHIRHPTHTHGSFVQLHQTLRRKWISVPAQLPTKHRTRTQDGAFAARRASELDQYLVELFRSPEARTCRHVQQFLNLPSAVQAPEVSVYFPPIT